MRRGAAPVGLLAALGALGTPAGAEGESCPARYCSEPLPPTMATVELRAVAVADGLWVAAARDGALVARPPGEGAWGVVPTPLSAGPPALFLSSRDEIFIAAGRELFRGPLADLRPAADGLAEAQTRVAALFGEGERRWAVGGRYLPRDGAGAIVQWDGARWRDAASVPLPLRGIWGRGQRYHAVGGVGALEADLAAAGLPRGERRRGGIWQWRGARWQLALRTTQPLHAVAGRGANDVWAVGGGGTILHLDGRRWSRCRSPTAADLYGVWAAADGSAWAVGARGTILEWRARRWQLVPSGVAAPLYAVAGDETAVRVVGGAGTVLVHLRR